MQKQPQSQKLRSMAELLWVFETNEAENETAAHIREAISKTKVKTRRDAGK